MLDEEYMEAMQLVRSGKNATHIDKRSKAYAYRQVMDQLCIETYRDRDDGRLQVGRADAQTERHPPSPTRRTQRDYKDVQDCHPAILLAKYES